jgi:hypothetical protein
MKAYILTFLIFCQSICLLSQDYRIQTLSETGRPMTTAFPFYPMTFVIGECDTVVVSVMKDSISRYEGKYSIYAYFKKGTHQDFFTLVFIFGAGAVIEVPPSHVDFEDSYYEYELSSPQIHVLKQCCINGILFDSRELVLSLVLDEYQTHIMDFLNRN